MPLQDQLKVRRGFVCICMIAVLGLFFRSYWVHIESQRAGALRDRLRQLVSEMGPRFDKVQVVTTTFDAPPDGVRILGWVSSEADRNELFDRVSEVEGISDPKELMRALFVMPNHDRP